VSAKANSWVIRIVLLVAVASLVGVSLVPLLNGAFSPAGGAGVSPSPAGQAGAEARKADLLSQVRGYELVLEREPENQTALQGLLEAKLELIRLQAAKPEDLIEPLERLTKLNPEDTRYQVLLAQTRQYAGDREGAAQAYREILKTKPGDQQALEGLVGLLLDEKRPEAAIGLLQDTLKTAPQANQIQPGSVDTTSVQLLLARVYVTDNRVDEAIVIYDDAIKAAPSDFRPILGKAILLKEQGKLDEAKPLFATAETLAPAQYKDQIKTLSQASASSPGTAGRDSAVPQVPTNAPDQPIASPDAVPTEGSAPSDSPE